VIERDLRRIPNVGPAVARMLERLGVRGLSDLRGQDPNRLYYRLCEMDSCRHDLCVLDTLSAVVDYASGAPARPWWSYSRQRKTAEQVVRRARPTGGLSIGSDASAGLRRVGHRKR